MGGQKRAQIVGGGHGREPAEHIAQIIVRIDPAALAGDDQRVDHRRAVTRVRVTDEEPVFRAQFAWADGVLNRICIELRVTVTQMGGERCPIERADNRRPDRVPIWAASWLAARGPAGAAA